ncbi:Maf family nucleotide pyrophosphatase [Flavobacteriaceae bacterium]|jgi:septum formation protein|nr:Maf family nucleotide pyrophosphatase [Flavobacteriaceae bacterium]|tara:strand:+ start:560 stop:1144 length:585 start_codon:yes stop_codon:yes gene_type:complete
MDTRGYKIILASGSPRRQKFFEEMEIAFSKKVLSIDENFPDVLKGVEIAQYIAKQKAKPFKAIIKKDEIIITADTIVWNKNKYLGKPKNREEATQILQSLSDNTHQVITAVGFLQKNKWDCIHEISEVTFGSLSDETIQSYIRTGSPMDKAGAYGIQDSFGVQNILSISGSYTNIIGLPVAQVLEKIKEIITKE